MNLFELAAACLAERDPAAKVDATFAAARAFAERRDDAAFLDPAGAAPAVALPVPGRPDRPRLVSPRELPQRKLSSVAGRAALVHAVTHFEFNAINLAWDAV